MAQTQQAITNALLDTMRGNNPLVNDLAKRRLYDTAVEEMNTRDRRPKVNFSKSINEEQTLVVSQAYPEFQITFYNTQLAVHSMAAGLRNLELEYMMMQVPYGSLTYDIGGNFASHLFKGRDYVHCCMPNLDVRDVMRHENQKDAVEVYLGKLASKGRPIPHFQLPAFERYANSPDAVVCHDTFQQCKHDPFQHDGRKYAVALHSLYDIPADEFGAALLRKDIHTCYAAFHFAEELLLEASTVELPAIGGVFSRDGDRLNFCFSNESTLNYSHSYSNVLKFVCKTYFLASNRYVYMKEFLVTRVNTMFCKFVKVDTYMLYKSVYKNSVDSEQFYASMEDAWHYKKTLAMLNSERIMLHDKSAVNFWFPKMKDQVIVPLFDISLDSGKRTRKEVLVNKDFVYTVLNHIRTYQAKALTYNNVLSFVESIRSRVIINGVTARSEWDVDKTLLQGLSMTFFLITKLAILKDEMMISKFKLGSKSISEHVWEECEKAFGNLFPSLKEVLKRRKLIVTSESALEIKVPDVYVTFHDRFVSEYQSSVEMPSMDISKSLTEAEKYYEALSELTVVKGMKDFDAEKFTRMCQLYSVSPELAAKIITAVFANESGVSIPFKQATEENLSEALSSTQKEDDVLVLTSTYQSERVDTASMVETGQLPMQGICKDIGTACFEHNEEINTLEDFHMMAAESVVQGNMASIIYQGSLQVQQMENYVDSLAASLSASVSNLKKAIKDTSGFVSDSQSKYGVYDVRKKTWLLQPSGKNHAWGVVEKYNGKCFLALLKHENSVPICHEDWRRVAVSSESLIYSDMAKLRNLRRSIPEGGKPFLSSAEMILVDGVPGCGKTKEILSRVNLEEDLILVPGREAAAMIRKRANASMNGLTVANNENVKTVDSFLMNLGKGCKKQWKNLYIDEGLMLHPGCVYFLVGLSHCEKAYIFGDTQQIPFINRVQNFPFPAHFAKLQVDSVEKRRTTLRCPADVTHFLNERYEGAVTCTSSVDRSVSFEIVAGSAAVNPVSKPLKGKVITFTQSDKSTLVARGYENVNTVHEIQGETYEEVSLVRLTPTPIGIISRDSPHVLVALSRHTKAFKYYTVVLDSMVSVVRDLESVSNFLLDVYKVESSSL
ncbi:129k replicase protein [Yellow tailflower mild mottle virus]|nr:129k replicase protein [Yellow tailflower mild mottle virus]AGZ63346.1 129k replicase protein [Yellow tailflower mild mottle virus]AGZ63350.1 129k replicase protein [Yellow tailflower mild mottle virus]